MTAKQYVEDVKNNLNNHSRELGETLKTKKRLCNLGSVIFGIAGIGMLASSFWLSLPFFGIVAGLQMRKATAQKMFNKSIANEQAQVGHLNSIVEKGLDIKPEAQAKRKQEMDSIEMTRRKANDEYLDANAKSHYVSAAFLGATALTCFFSNPITALIPFGVLLLKRAADDRLVAAHANLENAGTNLNNRIYDYNITSHVNAARAKKAAATTTRTAPTKQAAKTVQTAPRKTQQATASKRNQDAVDRYMQMLEQQKQQSNAYQKKKVV